MIVATKAAVATAAPKLPYQWVIAGAGGVLKTSTSTTASSWTTRTSSFSTTKIWSVASNTTDLYVAVGNDGKLATSPDGITWTQRTSSFSTTHIRGVFYANGYWVAVGDSNKAATSTDGITWTQRTVPNGDYRSVHWGNGLWAAMESDGSINTATDPTGTWTARTSTLSTSNSETYNSLHYAKAQAVWIAGQDAGTTGALASSTDGITWTARNSAHSLTSGYPSCTESNSSIIVHGSTLNFLTPTCDVQSTTDGTTWTSRTPATANASIYCCASDDTGFIIMVGNTVQSTTDGTTWTDRGSTGFSGTTLVDNTACCHSSGAPSIR